MAEGESYEIAIVNTKVLPACPLLWRLGRADHRERGRAALIRPRHAQNVQMKSQRSFGVITGDLRHTRAHAAKSSTAQAQCLAAHSGASTRELATDNGRPLQN